MTDIEAAREYGQMVEQYHMDPVGWAANVVHAELDEMQISSLTGFCETRKLLIVGCNGAGKDSLITLAALWLVSTRPFLKGQLTGPGMPQLLDVLGAELSRWYAQAPILQALFECKRTHIYWREFPERWFLTLRTTSKRYSKDGGEAQAEGIQGIRGELGHTFVGITEASGVDDANFDAADSCCTTDDSWQIIVGNALRRSGRFYDMCKDADPTHKKLTARSADGWHYERVPYTRSRWTNKGKHEGWIRKYGADSVFCKGRSLAQFPSHDDPATAISYELADEAMKRDVPLKEGPVYLPGVEGRPPVMLPHLQIGVDCARFGDDEAVISRRVGWTFLPLLCFPKCSGPELVQRIDDAAKSIGADKDTLIEVDESGLGGMGVVDPLREVYGYTNVVGCQNIPSQSQRFPEHYQAWDDEQWMETLPALFAFCCLPADEDLLAQLTTRRYKFTGKNEKQRRLESKDEMRKPPRRLPSPDRAEALMLAAAPSPRVALELYGGAEPTRTEEEQKKHDEEQKKLATQVVEDQIKNTGVFWPGGR